MTAAERRERILALLAASDLPVSAGVLARDLGVSRQVIVGDVALLRAAEEKISATPRGYLLDRPTSGGLYTIACRHGRAQVREELYTVVDNGGGVVDVVVDHAVYGQLSGQLRVFSRYDADCFCEELENSADTPLSALTGGVHLHTLQCPDEAAFRRIRAALVEKGFLLDPASTEK